MRPVYGTPWSVGVSELNGGIVYALQFRTPTFLVAKRGELLRQAIIPSEQVGASYLSSLK